METNVMEIKKENRKLRKQRNQDMIQKNSDRKENKMRNINKKETTGDKWKYIECKRSVEFSEPRDSLFVSRWFV